MFWLELPKSKKAINLDGVFSVSNTDELPVSVVSIGGAVEEIVEREDADALKVARAAACNGGAMMVQRFLNSPQGAAYSGEPEPVSSPGAPARRRGR